LPSHELRIGKVALTPHEREVYEDCKNDAAILIDKAVSNGRGASYSGILQSLMSLRLVCNHGLDLLHAERQERIQSYSNCSIPMPVGGSLPENQRYHRTRHQEPLSLAGTMMGELLTQQNFPVAPRAKNQWSEPPNWTTPPQPREPRSAGQERKKPKSERGSGCGGQMDRAQTMAEWEPQQCANTEMNGGPATAIWALDVWRSSMPSCRRSDSRLR